MIVCFNVCDHCGNQTEIQQSSSGSLDHGIGVELTVFPADRMKNVRFSPEDKKTFCDMDCFFEFLKLTFQKDGRKKRCEDE